jgi:hypothetical protein
MAGGLDDAMQDTPFPGYRWQAVGLAWMVDKFKAWTWLSGAGPP